jgi:TetR/AcrR family transcriptional regulator, tetracycline repressor protein
LSKAIRSRGAASSAAVATKFPIGVVRAHPRLGRPPKGKTLLSLQRLLKEALFILDEQGERALSMRALAERLGVTAMSLYRYCDSHEALLDAVHDEILAAHPPRPVTREQSWREVTTELARTLRRAFEAHPNAAMLFATRPVRSPRLATHVDAVLGCLVAAGFDPGIAVNLIDAVSAFTVGHSLAVFGQFVASTSRTPSNATEGVLHLNQLAKPERAHDFDAEFVVGLVAILDGFANRYAKRSR